MQLPGIKDVKKAHRLIKLQIHKTPVHSSNSINEITGADLYFKCENFQKVGAFKFRGATNAVLNLSDEEAIKGVATHSSGNHAQALALAAKIRGIPATIVMPENAPKVKIDAVRGYCADIVFCEPTLEAREANLEKVINEKGCTFIHPYNNFNVIAGQGTAALELLDEQPELEYIITPVGGGGLLSGTSITAKAHNKALRVIGAEPAGADDALRSFEMKKIVPSEKPNTICDGLLTSLGDMTFAVIIDKIDYIITVTDCEVIAAMRLIFERMKILVEPSAAVTLAVVIKRREIFEGKKCGLILSGGNIDLKRFGSFF